MLRVFCLFEVLNAFLHKLLEGDSIDIELKAIYRAVDAAAAMALSSVSVVGNALRLDRVKL